MTTTTFEAARETIASLLLDEKCHLWIQRQRQPQQPQRPRQRQGQQQQQQDQPHHDHPVRDTTSVLNNTTTATSTTTSPNPREQPQPHPAVIMMLPMRVAKAATTIWNLLKEYPSLAKERFDFPLRARCGRTMYPVAYFIWNSFSPQWITTIYHMYPQALSLPSSSSSSSSGSGSREGGGGSSGTDISATVPAPDDGSIDVFWGLENMEAEEEGGAEENEEDVEDQDPFPAPLAPYYLYQNLALKATFGCPTVEEYVNQCFLPLMNGWSSSSSTKKRQQQAYAEETLLWLIHHLPPELTSSLKDGYLFRHIMVYMNEHHEAQQLLFQQQQGQDQPERCRLSPKTIQTFISKMKEYRKRRGGGGGTIHEGHVEQLFIAGYSKEVLEYALDALLLEEEDNDTFSATSSAAMMMMMRIIPGMAIGNEKKRLTFNGRWKFSSVHADLFTPKRLSLLSWLHLDPTLGWTVDGWCRIMLTLSRSTIRILGLTATTTFLLKNKAAMEALGRFLNTKSTHMRFSLDLIGGGSRASLDPQRQREQQEQRQRRQQSKKSSSSSSLTENQQFFESFAAMLQTPEDATDPLSTPILLKQSWLFEKLSLHNFQQCDFRGDQGNDIVDLLVSSSKQVAMDVTGMEETNRNGGQPVVDVERRVSIIDESTVAAEASNTFTTSVVSAMRQQLSPPPRSKGLPLPFCPTEKELQIGLCKDGAMATQQVFQSVFAFSSMLSGNINMEYSSSYRKHDQKLSRQQQLNQLHWTGSSPCWSLSDQKILTGLTIDVSGVAPGRHDITDYLVLFLKSPSLRRLYIKSSDIEISSSGEEDDVIHCDHNFMEINQVCEAIQTNTTMKRLELEDLHIRNANGHVSAAPAIIAKAMEHNTTMKVMTINDQKVGYTLLEPWISDFKYVDAYSGAITNFYLWLNECGRGSLRKDDVTVNDLIPCLTKAMKPSERTEEALSCAFDAMRPSFSTLRCGDPIIQASETFERLSRTVNTWSGAPLYEHKAEVQAALYALLRECPDVWCGRDALMGRMPNHDDPRVGSSSSKSCGKRRSSEIGLQKIEAKQKKVKHVLC